MKKKLKPTDILRCGLTVTEYNVLHNWIKRKYGKAVKCENPNCKHKSIYFDWALKKGKKYERDISNFMQLCKSCHVAYDWTDNQKTLMSKRMIDYFSNPQNRENLRQKKIGSTHTDEVKKKMSIRMIGENNPMYGIRITGKDNHMYGKHHSNETRRKIAIKQRKVNEWQVRVIRAAVSYGSKQSDLSEIFNISRPSLNRIIKGTRYAII